MNKIVLTLIPVAFLLGIMLPFIQYDPSETPVEQINAVVFDSREIFGGLGFRQSVVEILVDSWSDQALNVFLIVAVCILAMPITRYFLILTIYIRKGNPPSHKLRQALGPLLVTDLVIVGLIVFSVWSSHLLIELFSIGSLSFLFAIGATWYLSLTGQQFGDVD